MQANPNTSRVRGMSEGATSFDPSERAKHTLNELLSDSEPEVSTQVAVTDALDQPFLTQESSRDHSRVLFITTDTQVSISSSLAQSHYRMLGTVFDEVHVMVLIVGRGVDSHERIATNVWIYTTHALHWWQLPHAAMAAAREYLWFGDTPRPDVIVATDVIESGLAGYRIAREFVRPFQVHVGEDLYSPTFKTARRENRWRFWMAWYVLRRVRSVRTTTESILAGLRKRYPGILDSATLPHFYNLKGLTQVVASFDVHVKYPQYRFVVVTEGEYTAESSLHDVFSALYTVLQSSYVGLIVAGKGPAQALFTEKVRLLGIERAVVFLRDNDDMISHLKTADAYIEADVSAVGDERVLRAAILGTPVVAYQNDMRAELFVDGQSAFLVHTGDTIALAQRIQQLINNAYLRKRFREYNELLHGGKVVEDTAAYYESFRDTIEKILVARAQT